MSTPNNPSSGPAPTKGPMKLRRRVADPLVRPKKKPVRPAEMASGMAPGGAPGRTATKTVPFPKSSSNASGTMRPAPPSEEQAVNGFSGPLLCEKYVDYPVVMTKRSLREAIKHHIARFSSKKRVDPRDESQFTRPVRLQRRDPRSRNQESNAEKMVGPDGQQLDEADREALDARRAAREKERAENLAQIAPSVGSTSKRQNAPKQKTQQVYKSDLTPDEISKARIKYEEALPWHLEDFDNKNVWVGNYEAALSETHAIFVLEDGKMRVIPVQKWYKFTAKSHFTPLSIEEAEKIMAKRTKDPRWFMEKQKQMAKEKQEQEWAKQRKVWSGPKVRPDRGEGLELAGMDFEDDQFADDEDQYDLFNDEDEDAKAAQARIKADQLKANVFDLKDEKDYDLEEAREKREREARHRLGKKVRKALKKREKNYDYSSGSDYNPYSDDDESSDDSEAERLKEEERKAEEEKTRKAEEEKNQKESASSTKGSNTPSGQAKQIDPLKKNRKRQGSPGSDASGTDTSRKKRKNKPMASQSQSQSQSSPQPTSRPISPGESSTQASKKRARNLQLGGSGSGSDVEAAAGSGAEMSESGIKKKLKLNPPNNVSRGGTPSGSRAASPVAGGPSFSGSRASSPEGTRGLGRTSTPVPSGKTSGAYPTHAEVHAAIPATGIGSSHLLRIFRHRLGDNHKRFIDIVKDVSIYGADKLLRPAPRKEEWN
ncbi:Transcription Factor IIF Rap30/Rap74 interaction [Penicillium chermesinum]|nr:Transcription Factor IIF Rap30/Rap74 interaction [Penicillium chermesinum]